MKAINYLSCLTIVFFFIACSEEKSDQERIIEDIDATSVHLTLGLKIITSNPKNDPEITNAQNVIKTIIEESKAKNPDEGLSLLELGQLARIAFQAKQLGADELARGKQSDFKYLAHLLASDKKDEAIELTVEQDHALTLGALYVLKLQPAVPIPISNETFLYEAWMAGDTDLSNEHINSFLRAAQVSTFAKNGYCDLALEKAELLRQQKLGKVDVEAVKASMSSLTGLGRAAAHAPQAAVLIAPIVLAPAIIEIIPGALRIKAHVETASCFEERSNSGASLKQHEYAIDAMVDMGIPKNDLAIFKAALAYKNDDREASEKHLRNAAVSKLLDQRSQQDLLVLADNINSPDESLVSQYFSSVSLSLTLGKIINQRLTDEGFYDGIQNLEQVRNLKKVLSGLTAVEENDILSKGKGIFDKLSE